jgi:hypothetical protein
LLTTIVHIEDKSVKIGVDKNASLEGLSDTLIWFSSFTG